MGRYVAVAALIIAGLFGGLPSAKSQSAIMNLPRVSQHARFTQRIGLTDITIDYHRPLVNGRKIFGGLQAYGQVWRADALPHQHQERSSSWVGHNNAARVAASKSDFDTAIKEMKLAATLAPESLKAQHADLVRRLENREDINK